MKDSTYRHIFESSPGCYLILDPNLIIVEVTGAYLAATKTRKEELLGRHLFDAFPDNPADADADGVSNLRRSLETVLREGRPNTMAIQKYDIQRPPEEGGGFEERHWSPVNVPVLSESGEVEFIIHSVQDVTQFVQLRRLTQPPSKDKSKTQIEKLEAEIFNRAQQIHSANRRLLELNEALSKSEQSAQALSAELLATNTELEGFTYTVSHDLRGPLRTIAATSRILLEELGSDLTDEYRGMLQRQAVSATRLSTLIDELLQLSRLSHIQLAMDELDLTALAHEVAQELLETPDIPAVTFKIAPKMRAKGDARLVRLVLVNLMENAVKFSPNGGEITVSSKLQDGVTAWCVGDSGIGLDMAHAEKVFLPFERLVHDKDYPGTGIGLANVKRITERHGGTVWVVSEPGQGAQFYFTLS